MKDKVETLLAGKKPYYWIVLVGFVLYFRSLFFGYTYFDDNVLIIDNLFFLKDLSNFFRSFTMEVFHILHASAAYYRPILTISYMIDAQFSGESPFFFHLSSVVVHIVVSCLLYIFLKKLKIRETLAFFLTLIFVVHPVLAQAVSWIPGRNDSLLALFALPAFIFIIDFIEKKKIKYFFFHIIFFALALFTKESSIFIPPLVMIIVYLFLGKRDIFKVYIYLFTGWFFIGLIWFYLRSIALEANPLMYGPKNALSSIVSNFPATLLYLGKVLFPFNLNVLPILQDSTLVYGIVAFIVVLVGIIFSKGKNLFLVLFGILWYLFFLIPAFIRPDTTYVADFLEHRIYVPIIGLLVVFSEIDLIRNLNFDKKVVRYIVFGYLIFLCLINFVHNSNFKDRLAFWKNAAANSPSHPLSHKNLGAMYYLDGNIDEAEKEFEKSLAINPTEPMIHNNLGLIYFRKGDYVKAEEEYYKELELYPAYDNAFMNLGLLYYHEEKYDKAEEMWLTAIQINPDHKEALKSLAIYYTEIKKDQTKANYYYQEALRRGAKF